MSYQPRHSEPTLRLLNLCQIAADMPGVEVRITRDGKALLSSQAPQRELALFTFEDCHDGHTFEVTRKG